MALSSLSTNISYTQVYRHPQDDETGEAENEIDLEGTGSLEVEFSRALDRNNLHE
jgi:hypothetical protein